MVDAFSNKKIILTALLLGIFEFLLYSKAIGFGFINFDDYSILLGRPHLYNEDSFPSSLTEILFKYFPREGPMILRDITWAIDSYLFGFKNPMGYHLGNVILHSINVGMLFFFLFLAGWSYSYALGVSMFYGVLPFQVETVCWVMGRKDLLVTFFMLAGLITQTVYFETRDKEKQRTLWLAGVLITLMALLSKPSAVTYCLVLVCHAAFYPYMKGSGSVQAGFNLRDLYHLIFPRYTPHLLISLCVYFWYTGIQTNSDAINADKAMNALEHVKYLVVFMPLVFALYLKVIFLPFGHSIYYAYPSIHEPLTVFNVVLSVMIAVAFVYQKQYAGHYGL